MHDDTDSDRRSRHIADHRDSENGATFTATLAATSSLCRLHLETGSHGASAASRTRHRGNKSQTDSNILACKIIFQTRQQSPRLHVFGKKFFNQFDIYFSLILVRIAVMRQLN